jgi:hypothetical protein
MTEEDFEGASGLFYQLSKLCPENAEVISNYAFSLLYNGRLTDAIQVLAYLLDCNKKALEEQLYQQDPHLYIREPLIFNLCSLYDLAWANSSEKKENLFLHLFPFLPDDFDVSVFKIPKP